MIGFDFLRRVSGILDSSLNSPDAAVFTAVFNLLDEVVDYESATLFVANPESGILEVAQSSGTTIVDLISSVGFERGHGLSGWIGARKDPLVLPTIGAENSKRGFCSLVSIPLWLDDRLVGVLNLGHPDVGFFSEDNRDDFAQLGLQLTMIVEQLRLRSQLKEKNDQLEKLLVELQEAQDQLVESGRLAAIGEVVVKLNHEINNPLTAIISFTDLLLIKYEGGDEGTLTNLETIRSAAYRISEVTEALKKIESSSTDDYLEGVKMLRLE